jgi:hypothetical protein
MEHINEIFHKLGKAMGLSDDLWSGRSAEVNERVARLMNRTVVNETAHEEYDRISKETKTQAGVR